MKMGNVLLEKEDVITMHELKQLEEQAEKDGYQHLTVRIPSADKKTLNTILKCGYILADTLIEYFFDMRKAVLPHIDYKCLLRDAEEKDLATLIKIAGESYKIDRFHSDEHLDNRLCDKYYEKWIENSFYGFADKVIVAEYQGIPVGYTTGKVYSDSDIGHLVLSAVSESARGLGVYTSMIHDGISWIKREHGDLRGVLVGTQLDNLAVQKAWIKLGFTVYGSTYVLQKYIGDLL